MPECSAPAIDLFARFEGRTHLEWAENIARLIARTPLYGFGPRSQEADDLVAVAQMALVRLAPRFDFASVPEGGDPDGQFRGWAHRDVRTECQREAERILSGGVHGTSNKPEVRAMRVGGIPERCPSCTSVMRARKTPVRVEFVRSLSRKLWKLLPLFSGYGNRPRCHRPVMISSLTLPVDATVFVLDGEPDLEKWEAAGGALARAHSRNKWDIGDWINYGTAAWGEIYTRAQRVTGLKYQTLRNVAHVARKFEPYRRRYNLRFGHHAEVVTLPPEKADELLARAEREKLSCDDLAELVAAERSPVDPPYNNLYLALTTAKSLRRLAPPDMPDAVRAELEHVVSWFAEAAGEPDAGDEEAVAVGSFGRRI